MYAHRSKSPSQPFQSRSSQRRVSQACHRCFHGMFILAPRASPSRDVIAHMADAV